MHLQYNEYWLWISCVVDVGMPSYEHPPLLVNRLLTFPDALALKNCDLGLRACTTVTVTIVDSDLVKGEEVVHVTRA